MFGFSIPDIITLCVYFALILGIGVWSYTKIRSQEDFLLGGRQFGKFFSTFASFGQSTSADGPAGVSTTVYTNGASGIWSSLLMLFVTPLFWITAPWLRRMRIQSMGDFYVERYGSKSMAAVYALIATIGMAGLLSVGFLAVAKTAKGMTPKDYSELSVVEQQEYQLAEEMHELEAIDPQFLTTQEQERLIELHRIRPDNLFSHVDERVLVWLMCAALLVYSVLGGLTAAFYTDVLQGICIIALSVMLLPFAWGEINALYGGEGILQAFTHMHDRLPESFFEVLGSPEVVDFTWYYILTAAVVSGVTVVTQPNQLVTSGAAKDESSARIGFVSGTLLKRILTVFWGIFALSAVMLFSNEVTNPDYVWGMASLKLLGPLNMGLVGLMLACMIAALMSTADCLIITVSGLVLRSLYTPLFPGKSEQHYIWVGRAVGVVFILTTAWVSLQFDQILEVLKFVWEFFVIFASAFWLGLKWRKAKRVGAWASIVFAFGFFYFLPLLAPTLFPSLRESPAMHAQTASRILEHEYTAKEIDVERREQQIELWNTRGREAGIQKPEPLELGDPIQRTHIVPARGIFWSKGLKLDEDGNTYGGGYLYLEMVLLDAVGVPLETFPYAMNESIRTWIRLLTPFLILVGYSLWTRSVPTKNGSAFFLKMRVAVQSGNREEDEARLAEAYQNPASTESSLLFPNSGWEFYRWSRFDRVGFALCLLLVPLVIGLLYLGITIGS